MLARQRLCSACGRLLSTVAKQAGEPIEPAALHPRQAQPASVSGRGFSASAAESTRATVFGYQLPFDWRFLGLAGTWYDRSLVLCALSTI